MNAVILKHFSIEFRDKGQIFSSIPITDYRAAAFILQIPSLVIEKGSHKNKLQRKLLSPLHKFPR